MAVPVDYSTYTDTELEAARVAVLTELERRTRMAAIPAQIQELAAYYEKCGGSITNLSLKPKLPVGAVPAPLAKL